MVSFLLGGPVKGKASESVGSANEYGTEVIEEMSPKEKYRARAQKILNLGLFKAIEQKSLRGVIFLLEGGADPTKENERGQTPIDFAECRFEEDLEALEYEEIIEVLRDWSPEQYPVDERMIIARARKIWGLKGGGGGASSAGGGGSSGSGGSGRSGGSGMSFSASGGDDHVRPSDLGSSGSRASELISNYQRSTMPGHGIFSRPTDAPTSSRAAEMISNARAPSFMRRDADTIASGGSPGMTNWATTMETGGHHHEMRSAHLSSSSISSSSFGTPIPEVSDPIRRDRETESGAGTETGLLTRIGEIAVQFIPGYDAYQILNNDGSIWEATKSLAKDGVATIAGMKFLKVGGKIITQNGGKVFELVKEGSKVLLKKGEEELGKAFGPRLVPEVVGGATTKLTQTESEATLPQVMLFSKAARPQPL
ncbi:MAG: ankyrin repeat domain-containing protein, partial [Puniceicoccales bacterium]|nr:ankyrin repeat domain-containing protein [Puniceicoccales bacterium]